jgi:hypothetical protein
MTEKTEKPETEEKSGFKCVVCFEEGFNANDVFTHEPCGVIICDGCYQRLVSFIGDGMFRIKKFYKKD